MNDDITVEVTYCDKNLQPVVSRRYSLQAYTAMLKYEILRIITDIEDALYETQGNKRKQNWDENVLNAFTKIRHKLLDEANAIERLPANIMRQEEGEVVVD